MKSRRLIAIVLSAGLVLSLGLLVASQVAAQAKDPFVGTWLLDRTKSQFTPYVAFFRRTMIIEPADGGVHVILRTVSDRQHTTETNYTAKYDGKDVPIDTSALDTVALKKVDANTVERIGKIAGEQVETATMKLSADGKTLTMTIEGSIPGGQDYKQTQVFDRQ